MKNPSQNQINYLKIGKASDLSGSDRYIYRALEILPGFLSWGTLIFLILLSYLKPTFVAYFMIAFDVYWLLLVFFLGIHLLASYMTLKKNLAINWEEKTKFLYPRKINASVKSWEEICHLIILPVYNESLDVIRTTVLSIANDGFPTEKMIIVLTVEERGGDEVLSSAQAIEKEFSGKFKGFLLTVHPDGIIGELKGKGANQAWAAKQVKEQIIDKQKIDYGRIITSVFDIDTVVIPGFFFRLTYAFLTAESPYRSSYQPIPMYHNNIWEAPFFARVAASSNTFWQMMQQIREEKLATYSSHSMSWKALVDIGFWSVNMVSEDSRIFWHCFIYYKGDYKVEPLYFPVSMDVCMDDTVKKTMVNLYKQQRRWGWGVENLPFLMFNTIKGYKELPLRKMTSRILVQLYGFHSWATNALIIAVIGWMPMILGGNQFNATVLSGNLPLVSRTLMTFAMSGLVLSAIVSTLLLPSRPSHYGIGKSLSMVVQWLILPISIIFFGAIPGLESQTRLMLGKYMGFWVTPKVR